MKNKVELYRKEESYSIVGAAMKLHVTLGAAFSKLFIRRDWKLHSANSRFRLKPKKN